MTVIPILAVILLGLMLWVGGKQGLQSFFSIVLNLSCMFIAIILLAFHVPVLLVAILTSIVILAIIIFMGNNDLLSAQNAFESSLIILGVLALLIVPLVMHMNIQGFGTEDSEELEGLSVLVGISFTNVAVLTTLLSALGAIAEAAMAIASGLSEILRRYPQIENNRLFNHGIEIGKEIIGTTFNTLFFGFFGGFLALFIWFYGLKYSVGQLLNDKIFVNEVMMILFSMVGVILTVPVTTFIAIIRKDHLSVDKK